MTQLSLSGARIVDPVLTTIAQGYQNAQLVGGLLFPSVPVSARAGKITQFGKEAFMVYDTERAPGGAVKRLSIGYQGQAFSLTDHALAAVVPVEVQEEAEAVPGIDMASASVSTVQDAMHLRLEIEQAALATAPANYEATNKVTLSGTGQLDHAATVSDPMVLIATGKQAVRSQIGKRPNLIIIGAAVFEVLKNHPKIIDRMKYTGRDIATPEFLASLFDVDTVAIGDAVQSDDAGAFSDVWGKNIVIAYVEVGQKTDKGRPTFGYSYQLKGYPVVEAPRYDGDTRSWLYDVADAVKPVIAAKSAGYLISAAIA